MRIIQNVILSDSLFGLTLLLLICLFTIDTIRFVLFSFILVCFLR